jgi:hypothetical protein
MAILRKTFSSVGGFAVNESTIIDDLRNITSANTIELKNSNFSDASRKEYIMRGSNTSILSLDAGNTYITLPSSTINFITSRVIGVNASGTAYLSKKIESIVTVTAAGDVQSISYLTTTLSDTVPSGQTWTIAEYDSGVNNVYSFSVSRSGTSDTVKWLANVDVTSILWT